MASSIYVPIEDVTGESGQAPRVYEKTSSGGFSPTGETINRGFIVRGRSRSSSTTPTREDLNTYNPTPVEQGYIGLAEQGGLKRNVGESDASYYTRAIQYGKTVETQQHEQIYKQRQEEIRSGTLQGQIQYSQESQEQPTTLSPTASGASIAFLTQKEGTLASQTRASRYWTLDANTPYDAVTESKFSTGLNLKTHPWGSGFVSRGLYEYNRQQINIAQEQYRNYDELAKEFKRNPQKFEGLEGVEVTETQEGKTYTLTNDFIKNNTPSMEQLEKQGLLQAKKDYSRLAPTEKRKLWAGGFIQGATSVSVATNEFIARMPFYATTRTINPEDVGKEKKTFFNPQGLPDPIKENIEFKGSIKEIKNLPTTQTTVSFLGSPTKYLKEKATSPEFQGGAFVVAGVGVAGGTNFIRSVKAQGFKATAIESIPSPYKIGSGIYMEKPSQVKLTSFKTNNLRIYGGTAGETINVYGAEGFKNIGGSVRGVGAYGTQQPYIKVSGGGYFVETGTYSKVTPYVYQQTGVGTNAFLQTNTPIFLQTNIAGGTTSGYQGGGFEAYSQGGKIVKLNQNLPFKKVTPAGIGTQDTPISSSFVSGQGQRVTSITREGIKTGVRFKPTTQGTEYDLTKLANTPQTYDIVQEGFNAGAGTTQIKATTPIKTNAPSIQIQAPTQAIKPPSTFVPPSPTRLIQEQAPSTTQKAITIQQPKVDLSTNTITNTKTSTSQIIIGKSRTKTDTRIKQAPVLNIDTGLDSGIETKQKQNVVVIPVVAQAQGQKQIQKLRQVAVPTTFTPQTNIEIPTPTPTSSLLIVPPPIPAGYLPTGQGVGRAPPFQEKGFTPSFTALFKKQFGRTKKSNKTGLDYRPIPKGFRFIKVKKIKL